MLRRAFRSVTALLVALTFAHATPTRAADGWTASADDALMLEVRSGQYRLGEGVRGYATPDGACVDLADTLIALDIALRLDKQSRRATGWAFDESRTIVIDRGAGTEQIMNEKRALKPQEVRDTPEGWCVAAPVLARWLGIGLTVDTGNALLIVKSERKLPVEAAAERRSRAGSARPAADFDLASLPHAKLVTRGFTTPAVEVVASVGGSNDRRSGSPRGARYDLQYEAFVVGEVGPVAYNARLSSDRRGWPGALRVLAYRTDPTARLLGPLRATTVAVGDVQGLSTPLVAQSSAGRGAMITNRPVERRDRFDAIDLRGDLPRGWDAELYRNGQLLGFAQDRADGRYEFRDVRLQYGPNRLEVVLYGPQGQIRREVRQVPVGLDSIPPHHTYYWAGANEDGRDLIDLAQDGRYRRAGWRGTLGVERGIDVRTSVGVSLHSIVVDQVGRRNFIEASVRRALGGALVEVSGSADTSGGTAGRLSAIGEIGRTHYAVATIWAAGFASDRVTHDVTGLHSVALDRIFGSGRNAIPVGIEARMAQHANGDDTIDAAARVSANLGPRLGLTGEFVLHDERRRLGPHTRRAEAGLLANARVGRVRLRGEARFEIAPVARLRTAALVGEWSARGDDTSWRAEFGYERDAGRARAALGYIRRFDRLALNASVEAASDGSVGAGLSVAFSLGRDPRYGGVRMTNEKLASKGSALVRVFRDANANGRRDVGEVFEAGVGLTSGRIAVAGQTDMAGSAVIDGLEPFQPVLIGVDTATLADPLVQPAVAGVVVTPRPGLVAEVEIALVATGDIDGTLVRAGGGAIEGVDLELVDAQGRAMLSTATEFDGAFLFEHVPYGSYTVRVAPLVADALKLDPVVAAGVSIDAGAPSVRLGAVAARLRSTVAAK